MRYENCSRFLDLDRTAPCKVLVRYVARTEAFGIRNNTQWMRLLKRIYFSYGRTSTSQIMDLFFKSICGLSTIQTPVQDVALDAIKYWSYYKCQSCWWGENQSAPSNQSDLRIQQVRYNFVIQYRMGLNGLSGFWW